MSRRASNRPEDAEELAVFARHEAWRLRPTANVDVDHVADLVLVTCLDRAPDVEIDPSPGLSAGFCGHAGRYLLTSLCLCGTERWRHPDEDGTLARDLLGPWISGSVDEQAAGGNVVVLLPPGQAAALVDLWTAFVSSQEPSGPG